MAKTNKKTVSKSRSVSRSKKKSVKLPFFRNKRVMIFSVLFAVVGSYLIYAAYAAPKTPPTPTPTGPLAFTQTWQDNTGISYLGAHGCFGVDNQATWSGAGTLDPGETYTFKPKYPTCWASEDPIIAMNIEWSGDTEVKLETTNPFAASSVEPSALGPWSTNQHLVGPVSKAANGLRQTNLCMLVSAYMTQYAQGNVGYSTGLNWDNTKPVEWDMTITNTGSQTATIKASGYERNGWINYMYPGCIRADQDNDHWNDLLEMPMLQLAPEDWRVGLTKNNFMGTNYVKGSGSTTANDEFDFSPADFNDDGKIDQTDVDKVSAYVGQGNNVAIDQISPNSDDNYVYKQRFTWRRYDIDGDGMVSQNDVNWVTKLVGSPMPLTSDILDPWAVVKTPSTIPARTGTNLYAYAVDNDMISHVDFYAGGKKLCEHWGDGSGGQYKGIYLPGTTRSYYYCSWPRTPSKGQSTTVLVKVYDNAGHSYTASKVITGQ